MGNGNFNPAPIVGPLLDFGLDQLSGAIQAGRNKRFWRMQNEYNHPRAQMQRLEEAGLNPNLVYGKGATNIAGPISPAAAPVTSRYQDARLKSAQFDNVQLNNDLVRQKVEQARIATDLSKEIHAIMMAHPEIIEEVGVGPDGTTSFRKYPSELSRVQTQALAEFGMKLDEAQLKEIQLMVSGDLSYAQGLANLARTEQLTASEVQKTKALYNNNRLWDAIDELVKGSGNPAETVALVMKALISYVKIK